MTEYQRVVEAMSKMGPLTKSHKMDFAIGLLLSILLSGGVIWLISSAQTAMMQAPR